MRVKKPAQKPGIGFGTIPCFAGFAVTRVARPEEMYNKPDTRCELVPSGWRVDGGFDHVVQRIRQEYSNCSPAMTYPEPYF